MPSPSIWTLFRCVVVPNKAHIIRLPASTAIVVLEMDAKRLRVEFYIMILIFLYFQEMYIIE